MNNVNVNEVVNYEEGAEQAPSVGQAAAGMLGLTFLAGLGTITGLDFGGWCSKKVSRWWNKKDNNGNN